MAVEFKDYYKILGVDRTADDKAIKAAYRKLARKHHPDVAKGKDSGDRFREINEAYEVLSDPEKRRRYDTLGPDWQRYEQAPPGAPARGRRGSSTPTPATSRNSSGRSSAIAAAVAAGARTDTEGWLGGFMGGGRRPTGQDVQAGVTISLEEAYSGTRKSLEFEVEEPCPTCHGAGNVSGKPCTTCHGSGWQGGATTST